MKSMIKVLLPLCALTAFGQANANEDKALIEQAQMTSMVSNSGQQTMCAWSYSYSTSGWGTGGIWGTKTLSGRICKANNAGQTVTESGFSGTYRFTCIETTSPGFYPSPWGPC